MYHDALAAIRKLGRPTFFVTVSCNPNWPDVRNVLLPGQKRVDRPDILARVFARKKEEIIRRITREKVPVDTIEHFLVIEFQRRGLPRAHIAVITSPETRRGVRPIRMGGDPRSGYVLHPTFNCYNV